MKQGWIVLAVVTWFHPGPAALRAEDLKRAGNEDRAVRALEEAGCTVERDDRQTGKPVTKVYFPEKTTSDDLEKLAPHLRGLPQLRVLSLKGSPVTDGGLKQLRELTSLGELDLNFTRVTDQGLKELKGLTKLQDLYLGSTAVTDAGLKELKGLSALRLLNLFGTRVTDEGLKELTGLKNLQRLHVAGSGVTKAGIEAFRKRLPKCRVY
jgi:internalin A